MGWVAKKACQVMRDGKPVELEPGAPLPEAKDWAPPWVRHKLAVAEFINEEESAPAPAPAPVVAAEVEEPVEAPQKSTPSSLFGKGAKKTRNKKG